MIHPNALLTHSGVVIQTLAEYRSTGAQDDDGVGV